MASAPSSVQRSFSKSSSGPSGTPRASTCPAGSGLGNQRLAAQGSPVVKSQSSAKTSCNWVTTGPRTRKWMSCTGLLGWRCRQWPDPDVDAAGEADAPVGHQDLPVRAQIHGHEMPKGKGGEKARVPHTLATQSAQDRGPGIPRARRVNEHADLDAPASGVPERPGEGQPNFVSVEDVGAEGDGLAGLLNRFQHRGKGLVSIKERLDPVARQQRPLHHAAHYPRQHGEVPGVAGEMAVQFLWRAMGCVSCAR